VSSTVGVADAPLTAGTVTASGGVEGLTAGTASFTFTDANPIATPADFTASCTWGDGANTTGTVTGSGGGPYTVTCAGHTYAEEGLPHARLRVRTRRRRVRDRQREQRERCRGQFLGPAVAQEELAERRGRAGCVQGVRERPGHTGLRGGLEHRPGQQRTAPGG